MGKWLGLAVVGIVLLVLFLIQLEVRFKNHKVQRLWSWIACSVLGALVIWLFVLFVFVK
jgi:hypothetical protein